MHAPALPFVNHSSVNILLRPGLYREFSQFVCLGMCLHVKDYRTGLHSTQALSLTSLTGRRAR